MQEVKASSEQRAASKEDKEGWVEHVFPFGRRKGVEGVKG